MFYGTAAGGGSAGDNGTFFKISSAGVFTSLYSFTDTSDGMAPWATLTEGDDGSFYGTATGGGTGGGNGTIFKVTPAGALDTLYSFQGGNDGSFPEGQLLLATDGNFYGTASKAGVLSDCYDAGCGTVFQFTPSNNFSSLYQFTNDQSSSNPYAGLIQANDGNLYGTGVGIIKTGVVQTGAVYKTTVSPSLVAPVQLALSSSTVAANSSVTLYWQVLNAFSLTMQQCYAFVQNAATGAGTWTGLQSGKVTDNIYSGSAVVTPTEDGTYTYALTCGGIESGFATLTVSGITKFASTTHLTASPDPLSAGQSATLIASVTGSGATPTGSVTFSADGVTLGSASLNGAGVATLTASTDGINPGIYPVIAIYFGDSSYDSSISKALNVTVSKAPTSVTLTASPASVIPPAYVTLTATVKRSASASKGTPAGSMTFYADESFAIATVKLTGGAVTVAASSAGIGAGSYPITAVYSGDSSDSTSTSSAITVAVK